MPTDKTLGSLVPLVALLMITGCAGDDPPPVETAPEPVAEAQDAPAEPAPSPVPSGGPALTAERTGDGLGLSEDELVQVFADSGLDPAAFETLDLGDGRRVLAASYPESTERQVLWVAVFGGDDPHTIRLDYFPLQAAEEDGPVIGGAMDNLMKSMFPAWDQGVNWPEAAGQAAWQGAVQVLEEARQNKLESVNIPVAEMRRDGVWLSALSVPGRNVSYVLTTKESCRPSNPESEFAAGFTGCS